MLNACVPVDVGLMFECPLVGLRFCVFHFVQQRRHGRPDQVIAATYIDDNLAGPERIAATYPQLFRKHRSTWTFEVSLRPRTERW